MIAIEPPLVREASRSDAEAICHLLRSIGLGSEHVLAPGSRYWIAEDSDGALVGVIGLELGANAALLRSAGVHPAWRGCGLGALLTRQALVAAREAGCSRVYLFSTDAGSYWTRQQFREVPVPELVAALPRAPQVLLYERKGWLPTEVAWRRDL